MKKKCIFVALIMFFSVLILNIKVYAADLDVVQSFIITASPREDATVDFRYQIRWKVLDSTSQGPLTWVKIGLPNSYAESIKALTDNIASIKKTGEYVRIDFDDEYKAGEVITFAFSFHQPYLCEVKNGKVIYEYIPAWFDDCKVNNLVVSWDGDGTVRSNNNKTEGNLLIWEKENLSKKQKVEIEVQYDESYFSEIDTDKPKEEIDYTGTKVNTKVIVYGVILIIIIINSITSPSYSRHRGYYGSTYTPRYHRTIYNQHRYGSRPRPRPRYRSDDWKDSGSGFGGGGGGGCACACACAGSGRAGCSKKDFYGTKLKSREIIEELEK